MFDSPGRLPMDGRMVLISRGGPLVLQDVQTDVTLCVHTEVITGS